MKMILIATALSMGSLYAAASLWSQPLPASVQITDLEKGGWKVCAICPTGYKAHVHWRHECAGTKQEAIEDAGNAVCRKVKP